MKGSVRSTPIDVRSRGVGRQTRDMLRDALAALGAGVPRRPLFMRGSLRYTEHPARERPARADAAVDLGGRVARAHAEARTPIEAIDLLLRHLRRQLREERRRERSRRRRPGRGSAG